MKSNGNRESIKLDEIMRSLFDVSKDMLVTMLNNLFNENYSPDMVDISKGNAKFVSKRLEVIEGDFFLRLIDMSDNNKPCYYLIEFQTRKNDRMAIRVFQYAVSKAEEQGRLERPNGSETVLYVPNSLVIHVEEHTDIPNEYTVKIVFPDGDSKQFTVPVFRYWEHDDKALIDKKLYPLLPLRVFQLRATLDKITAKGSAEAKREAIRQATDAVQRVTEEAVGLHSAKKLNGDDLETILSATEYLFKYLNRRYKVDPKLDEEVRDMIKTLYDPAVYNRGKVEGKIELITNLLSDLDDYFEGIQEMMFTKNPDEETLKTWSRYAKTAESVDEFIDKAEIH